MYPYIVIGSVHLGMFGLLLWLAAVAATVVLHKNFNRNSVNADALNVVALVMVAGIVGAKTWHELQDVHALRYAMRIIREPGWKHPGEVVALFLGWFRDGFAWFGGMLASIVVLMVQGERPGARVGAVRMLDLAAPAAALGYGIGRIGCLLAGDGDYGINTTLPWGVHMAKDALVPPHPPDALVQPTPIYELLFALAVFWLLWELGKRARPVGWMTGVYLTISGIGRFLVEFVRINPKIYFHQTLTNAQVAAAASAIVGLVVIALAQSRQTQWTPSLSAEPQT
jgi:phosphatidylglycerol:prolipoprotein diacylglycerol transferase